MNYSTLLNKIEIYKEKYNIKSIGVTPLNRQIYAVEVLKNKHFSTAFLIASIHARENITSDIVCKMLDENLFDELQNINVVIIPMANPDGVELCCNGLNSVPENEREFLIETNKGSFDFSLWKANARGVDLNNNFDANFGTNIGRDKPASSGYVGEVALSELETQALVKFTREVMPFFTVSYHSKGEEIYFNFFQDKEELERDEIIARRFESSTGYKIKNPEKISSGGYKDFCVQKLKIPSITIEVGSDSLTHPIGVEYLDSIYQRHKSIAKDLEFAYNVFCKY